MIVNGTALLYICIGLYFLYCLFYQITGFSVPLKKEHEENRRKKEEEQDQMWRDIKPIYSTLESQTIIVRGLRPKTPWAEQLTVPPPPPQDFPTDLYQTHLYGPQNYFFVLPPGFKLNDDFHKKLKHHICSTG